MTSAQCAVAPYQDLKHACHNTCTSSCPILDAVGQGGRRAGGVHRVSPARSESSLDGLSRTVMKKNGLAQLMQVLMDEYDVLKRQLARRA